MRTADWRPAGGPGRAVPADASRHRRADIIHRLPPRSRESSFAVAERRNGTAWRTRLGDAITHESWIFFCLGVGPRSSPPAVATTERVNLISYPAEDIARSERMLAPLEAATVVSSGASGAEEVSPSADFFAASRRWPHFEEEQLLFRSSRRLMTRDLAPVSACLRSNRASSFHGKFGTRSNDERVERSDGRLRRRPRYLAAARSIRSRRVLSPARRPRAQLRRSRLAA